MLGQALLLSVLAKLPAAGASSAECQGSALLQTGVTSAVGKSGRKVLSNIDQHDFMHEYGSDISPTLRRFPWPESVKKLHQMPPMPEVTETIWSSGEVKKCGAECAAHCIAGQPREFPHVPGLRKALKHRLFQRFSPDYVVFGVFVTSAYHHTQQEAATKVKDGDAGYARTNIGEMQNEELQSLVAAIEEVGVDRAMLLNESCHDPSCMESPRLQCDARDLNLTSGYSQSDGKVHHICDVQFRRFGTCMNLIREYEQDHGMQFAWVTRSRPDVYWVAPILPMSALSNQVYVTPWTGSAYGGIDWFFMMPRSEADVFSRFPDEASCSQLHHPQILPGCAHSLGCECWMASWFYREAMNFTKFTKAPYAVSKFCGAGCPHDWNVTEANIEHL